jgi:hypothetical protein
MKDSTNGKKPTGTSKIQKLDLDARKLRGTDINRFNPMKTKLHISLVTLKVPMLQIPPKIKKIYVRCPNQNQLCVYHPSMKEKHK